MLINYYVSANIAHSLPSKLSGQTVASKYEWLKANSPVSEKLRHPTSLPICCAANKNQTLSTPYPTFPLNTNLASSESTFNPPPSIRSSLSSEQEDAVSSETEDSDRALKPGLHSNLLHRERKEHAREEAAERRGERGVKEIDKHTDRDDGIGT